MTITAVDFPLERTPLDPKQLGSPDWWVKQLHGRVVAKRPTLNLLHRYSVGDAPLMDLPADAREAFIDFQRRARTNFAGLSVEVMLDRMKVAGVRTGAAGDALGDSEAWDMWQANQLDADAPALHRASLVMGEAFVIVGDIDDEIEAPLITIEDPRNIAIARDGQRRRRIDKALKVFVDEWTGNEHAYLYERGFDGYPATVRRAEITKGSRSAGWRWIGEADSLPFSQPPIVWFPNRLDIDGRTCWGEFQQDRDVLDRINTTILQRLVITAMQAFRQKMLTGLPLKDENGAEINYDGMFPADPAALWQLPAGVALLEGAAYDPTPLLMATKDDVTHYAAQTRTPLPSLQPDAANQSGANTEMVWAGHIAKCLDRMSTLSEGWEEVVQLGFLWKGETERARRRDMEVLWMPPDIPSLAERYDAVGKAQAAGMPEDFIRLHIVGMSPQEIRRYQSEMATAEVAAAAAAAAAAEDQTHQTPDFQPI